jgi:hypothetical protein
MQTRNGNQVSMRQNGKPSDVHVANRGMDIHHGLSGNRRVAVDRPDHSRVVAERGGRGYVQRPYSYRGHEFAHRTYYANGRAYDRYYRHSMYRGVYMDVYAPSYYYRPAFYGWAYNPWAAPVYYGWGWRTDPWYGYYGYYFTPYAAYPSASVWLTDYMVSTSLAASYQERANAGQAQSFANGQQPSGATALTPQVKDMIAAEVQRQVALENAEAQTVAQHAEPDPASSGIQRMMNDKAPHVFVAGHDLDVVDASGTECSLSSGDALQLTAPPAPEAIAATLTMLSSKGGTECRAGVQVSVAVADLQEMQNHMREVIDQGMGELQSKQGKGGLPKVPLSAYGEPVKAEFAAAAPGPEPDVANQIGQQTQEADRAEKETLSETPGDSSPAAPAGQAPAPGGPTVTPTLAVGQTIADVTGAIGQPTRIVNLGAKQIYVFKDMKVTFTNGKVTDIQ